MRFFVLCFLGLFLSVFCFGETVVLTPKQICHNLNVLENTFSSKYAPLEWKKTSLNQCIEANFQKIKQQIGQKHLRTDTFHQILRKLFLSFQDYHANILFYSTSSSQLPFITTECEGRVFVTWSQTEQLDIGDELISWNDKPILEFLTEFQKNHFFCSDTTTQALSHYYLTLRKGLLGMKTPQGKVRLFVQSLKKNEQKEVQLEWAHQKDDFFPISTPSMKKSFLSPFQRAFKEKKGRLSLKDHPFFNKCFSWIEHKWTHKERKEDSRPLLMGQPKSFVPELGEIILASDSTEKFNAYLFHLPNKKKGGYLRIADYEAKDLTHFREWIRLFEAAADVLVIDQVDNPGGNLFQLYCLASHLSSKPLKACKQHLALTHEEVDFALQLLNSINFEAIENDEDAKNALGDSLYDYPIDYTFALSFKDFLESIVKEWYAGNTFSSPLAMYGIDSIQPHFVHFTKPILVLINEKDFSCADLLPAILQDNGRAKLFGTKTAGAGGCIYITSYPNLAGIIAYSFTGSLIKRADGSFIENVGVFPDIPYALQADEVQQGTYENYKKEVIKALNDLITPSSF